MLQPDHPVTMLRHLLTGVDSSITDAQLEQVYTNFCRFTASYPSEIAFTLFYPQVRNLYIELFMTLQLEHSQVQLTVQALGHQAEQYRAERDQLRRECVQFEERLAEYRAERNQLRETVQSMTHAAEHQASQLEHHTQQLEYQIEHHAQEIEKQRQHYEALLADARSDREHAVASDKQNTLILRNHLLQAPRLTAPALKGSGTRAENWRAAKAKHHFQRRPLPTTPATVHAMRALAKPRVDAMMATRYPSESAMYPDFLGVLGMTLTERASCHDTSSNPFLGGLKPDLTLALPGLVKPEANLVCAVVEVKKPDVSQKQLENDTDLGQVFDYLVAMFVEQGGRRVYTGILSCVNRNIVVTLEIIEAGWSIVQHNNSDIYETLAYLHDTGLVKPSHLPPSHGFLCTHGKMRRRLGNPRHSMVGEFPVKGRPGITMAVKRYANPSAEITFLQSFLAQESRPHSIPMLLYVAEDESEFGIYPVGDPLVPGVFANQVQAQTILTDVLDALVWLHARGIVHRDVRCENVVVQKSGHGMLIDFDAACDFQRGSARPWRGGYICCPPAHVRMLVHVEQTKPNPGWWSTTLYCPSPADDWGAWLLLANCLMFPTPFAGFQSDLVGSATAESRRLLSLWDALERSSVWGPFVLAARNLDVATLRELPSMFTWL